MQYNISDLHLAFDTDLAFYHSKSKSEGYMVTALVVLRASAVQENNEHEGGDGGRLELMTNPIMAVSCDSTP